MATENSENKQEEAEVKVYPCGVKESGDSGSLPRIVLELPPSEENCRNSEGDFAVLADGTILFVYSHFMKGTGGDNGPAFLGSRISRDGGRTWSAITEKVVPNEGGMNVMSSSFLRLKNGDLALFYLRKNSEEDERPMMRVSHDEGKTWGEPSFCVPDSDIGYYVMNNCRVTRLSSGRIVLPLAWHRSENGKIADWAGQCLCYFSDDDGATWHRSRDCFPTFLEDGKRLVTQEPGIVELADGRVMIYARTDHGGQWFYYSSDGCDTWTRGEQGTLFGPCAPATVKRLSNGDLFAVWNDHEFRPELSKDDYNTGWGSRRPLTVAVSHDEGRTWVNRHTLDDDPEGWFCYSGVLELEDSILLSYCALKGLRHSRITRMPKSWLYSAGE